MSLSDSSEFQRGMIRKPLLFGQALLQHDQARRRSRWLLAIGVLCLMPLAGAVMQLGGVWLWISSPVACLGFSAYSAGRARNLENRLGELADSCSGAEEISPLIRAHDTLKRPSLQINEVLARLFDQVRTEDGKRLSVLDRDWMRRRLCRIHQNSPSEVAMGCAIVSAIGNVGVAEDIPVIERLVNGCAHPDMWERAMAVLPILRARVARFRNARTLLRPAEPSPDDALLRPASSAPTPDSHLLRPLG